MQEKSYQQKITEATIIWLAKRDAKHTAAELGRMADVHPSYITDIKAGKTHRNVGNGKESPISLSVYQKLGRVLKVYNSEYRHWDTPYYEQILRYAGYCQKNSCFGMLTGNSSIGKTYAFKDFATRPKVVYLEAKKDMSGADVLVYILKRFGKEKDIPTPTARARYGKSAIFQMHQMISKFVEQEENKGWLIIIDDLEDKSKSVWSVIKDLCDDLGRSPQERKAGLLICGTNEMKEYLYKKHRKIITPYTQLYNRLSEYEIQLTSTNPQIFEREFAGIVKEIVKSEGYATDVQNWFGEEVGNMGKLNAFLTDLERVLQKTPDVKKKDINTATLQGLFKDFSKSKKSK